MQTFSKEERLSSKKAISDLFEKGDWISHKSLRVKILTIKSESPFVKVVVSVPKRIFKRAVDRNKIKRLIRETYRKNISIINTKQMGVHIMFIYTHKNIPNYSEIEVKMIELMQMINKKINI